MQCVCIRPYQEGGIETRDREREEGRKGETGRDREEVRERKREGGRRESVCEREGEEGRGGAIPLAGGWQVDRQQRGAHFHNGCAALLPPRTLSRQKEQNRSK